MPHPSRPRLDLHQIISDSTASSDFPLCHVQFLILFDHFQLTYNDHLRCRLQEEEEEEEEVVGEEAAEEPSIRREGR